MRVLHVISSFEAQFGGPSEALVGLALAQVHAGLEVKVVAPGSPGPSTNADRLRSGGAEVALLHAVPGRFWGHAPMIEALGRLVSATDIVHIHALWEGIQHGAAVLGRRLGRPYVMRPCGMLDPWSLSQGRLRKRLYLWWRLRTDLDGAAAIHFTTQSESQGARPLGLEARALVIPNGLDLADFAVLPTRGGFRVRHPRVGERRIVLFLGRLHPKKGLDLLIPAWAKLALPDAVLVVTGPDADGYARHVDALARAAGVADSVLLTGPLYGDERLAALVDADLFVLPSRQENFGIAVVEALAAGTPVLVSDQVALHGEILEAAVGGVVRLEVDDLARGLSRWLSDEPTRRAAASAARPFVRERYDWERIAGRWAKEYAEITAPARA